MEKKNEAVYCRGRENRNATMGKNFVRLHPKEGWADRNHGSIRGREEMAQADGMVLLERWDSFCTRSRGKALLRRLRNTGAEMKDIEKLKRARRWIRNRFNELQSGKYRWFHPSHAASRAMTEGEKRYGLRTFGVKGDSALNDGGMDILYLNTGDLYERTICFFRDRFIISDVSWCAESWKKKEGKEW